MASTITITQVSPSIAYFKVSLDAGTPVAFMQSGAVGTDKDLTSLSPGPLKEYLNRLSNWGILSIPASGAKARWRRITTNDSASLPVAGGVTAPDATIAQSAATAISFVPSAGATVMLLELALVHSSAR
jgi:hypothetical protein